MLEPGTGCRRADATIAPADAVPAMRPASRGFLYPSLPAVVDAGFVRMGGSGMGNCFFAYFHAVVLAERTGRRLIAPAWINIGIGALRRGDHSRRRYGTMFRRHACEIGGLAKAWALASRWSRRATVTVGAAAGADGPGVADLPDGNAPLLVVRLGDCWFGALLAHRVTVRRRLLECLAAPPAEAPSWGTGDYAAVHVRLGDFAATDGAAIGAINTRLPMAWYRHAIATVRAAHPGLPIRLYSDGHAAELAPLLALAGVLLERGQNDIFELLAMASARILVGSNSTFSWWAAFLGNMPTIWAAMPPERLCDDPASMTVLAAP